MGPGIFARGRGALYTRQLQFLYTRVTIENVQENIQTSYDLLTLTHAVGNCNLQET